MNLTLTDKLSTTTPFGGHTPSEHVQEYFKGLLETSSDAPRLSPPTNDCPIDLDPIEVAITLDDIAFTTLDYLHHEAFYVVSASFEVTPYRTCWLGLTQDSETITEAPTIGNGAYYTVRWYEGVPVGDGVMRGRCKALKDLTGDMLDRGVFDEESATRYMIQKLRTWTRDQELHVTRPAQP
nr:DUF6735 family protein [Halomicroarcula marina]